MKLENIIKDAKNLMYTKIKITKKIYKDIDSYHRRQIWIGKELIKSIKKQYEKNEKIFN